MALVELHALSHSLYMADALIAATALAHSLPILTGNAKHFKVVAGLQVVVFKP
jgi:predicted nucleic acid-binding protein